MKVDPAVGGPIIFLNNQWAVVKPMDFNKGAFSIFFPCFPKGK